MANAFIFTAADMAEKDKRIRELEALYTDAKATADVWKAKSGQHHKRIRELEITAEQDAAVGAALHEEIRDLEAENERLREVASTEALAALKNYQQADEDGVMVLVSRQAIDEVVAALEGRDE